MAEAKNVFLSNLPVIAAGAVALLAVAAWMIFWLGPDEDAARVPKAVEAKAAKADALPPLRPVPPPGGDSLPPVRTPSPEPAPSQPQAAAPTAPPTKAPPQASVKASPALPATAAAPPAERAAAAPPPVKRVEKSAAEPLPASVSAGTYVGNISGSEAAGLTLVISGVEGGVVKGTASLVGGGPCDDGYPMQGSARGGKLELRATRMGGRAGDCPLTLSLAVDGNRITGSTGSGGAVQLTRR